MRNKQIVLAIFSMLLLLCSCAAQPNIAPQTQERETPQEKGPEMPESASTAANELFQMLLDAACLAGSTVRFGAWLDAHPDYADTVQDASCEYAAMENGTERVRFLKTNCDRFSRYAADAAQTVVYQLWLVDGEVREGVSGALEPAPAEWEEIQHHHCGGRGQTHRGPADHCPDGEGKLRTHPAGWHRGKTGPGNRRENRR